MDLQAPQGPVATPLDIVVADYGATARLKSGEIAIAGVAPRFLRIEPILDAYRRMVRAVEFDICQLTPTTYMIARAAGAPYIALPIFLSRRFHHAGLICSSKAGIASPRDLEGKRVAARSYTLTTAVWSRGILADEYGLDSSRIDWLVNDDEHIPGLALPPNVTRAPPGRTLAELLASGEVAAAFLSKKELARLGAPAPGRDLPEGYHDLFPDAAALEADWYKRTRIYPMHALIVVKDATRARHPQAVEAVYRAFLQAHDEWVARLHSGATDDKPDRTYRALSAIVGPDPMPYGIAANLPSIQAMHDYALQQGLLPRAMAVDEMFLNPDA